MKKIFIIFALFCLPMVAVAQFGHWEEIFPKDNPGVLYQHKMAPIGKNKVLLFGGIHIDGTILNNTWFFDLDEMNWKLIECKTKPKGRDHFALTQISEKRVMLFGGDIMRKGLNDLWIFDLDSMNWFELHPENETELRYWHAMAPLNENEVAVMGGYVDEGTSTRSHTEHTRIYNILENRWEIVMPSSNYRFGRDPNVMVNIANDIVLMAGGYGFSITWEIGPYRDDYYLLKKDDAENKWKWFDYIDFRTMLIACHSGSAAKIAAGLVLYFGGACYFGQTDRSDRTLIFDYFNNTWTKLQLPVSPQGRYLHQIAKIDNNKILMYGGLANFPEDVSDTWLFVLDTVLGVEDNNFK